MHFMAKPVPMFESTSPPSARRRSLHRPVPKSRSSLIVKRTSPLSARWVGWAKNMDFWSSDQKGHFSMIERKKIPLRFGNTTNVVHMGNWQLFVKNNI